MSKPRYRLHCVKCSKEFKPGKFWKKCDACQGLIDIDYDLSAVKIDLSRPGLMERYWDLLPALDPANRVETGAGNTPTVHATRLGKKLGLENLFLKDETKNPTGTVKDRPAAVVLSWFKEIGIKHFTSSATGNSSTAFAVACIKAPEFEHSIFMGDRWKNRLTFKESPNIHVWILEGATVNEAIAYSRVWEKENGIEPEGGFFNLGRREGLKLAFLEATDQVESAFDWYFQGVSTAMGVYGSWKGAKQYHGLKRIDRLPKMGCVQEATCCPQVNAWKGKSPELRQQDIVKQPDGIADAMLKGDPSDTYPYMYNVVKESNGLFESVTADEIRAARTEIFEYEGIRACNASSTTVAAIRKLAASGVLKKQERIMAAITGSDRDPNIHPRRYNKVVRGADGAWKPIGEHIEEAG